MPEHSARRLPLLRAAITGFFSGVTRAVIGWVITNVLDR